jgi:hypothetical protein
MRPRTRSIFIGMRQGHLTVVRDAGPNKYRQTEYECRCDCGGTVLLRTSHFVPERLYCTRGCRLLFERRKIDLTGKRFGRWLIKSYAGRGYKNRIAWNCVCDCGTERVLETSNFIDNQSLSCGCLGRDLKRHEHTPERRLEIKRERSRICARKNPARVKNNKIKYESKLKRATPSWLTTDDWAAMNRLYEEARRLTRETGIRHEVDHIAPINGKYISGLHVPGNLQILTQAQNVAKLNRYADLSGD